MSAEHKRPLFAFVMVSILCAVMLGHAIRSDALGGLFAPSSDRVAAQAPAPVAPEPRAVGAHRPPPRPPAGSPSL